LAALFCAPLNPAVQPRAERPTLLVFFTIDQMRSDYLERFQSQLNGGLARLVKGGAVFSDGHHDHAITETAPGHASLMSGRFPRSTGITRNIAGVNDRQWTLIGTRELGAAPFRFRGTTLTDWLAAADPATRAFSVSAKDRSAILPIGRGKHEVYWYANNGTFTTSIWYRDTLPTWVQAFNARRIPHSFAGKEWRLLLDEKSYPEKDSVPYEGFRRNQTFPHRFSPDSTAAASQVRFSPMMDEMTLAFSLQALRTLDLGRGPTTDVMAISLSATDYVGHFYGPESREQHDQIVRLDRAMGAFLDTLFTLRDSARIIVALSADHGGGLIPELHDNLRVDINPAMDAAKETLKAAGGDTTAIDIESGAFFIDAEKIGAHEAAAVEAFIRTARTIPGVQRVDRWRDLGKMDTTKDHIARRWLHMFPDDMLPVVVVTLKEGNIYNYPIVATHGSPHSYDSHVPIIFYGPPFQPGRYRRFVRTVDIGPTLARALGVEPTEPLDGRPLSEAFRP
jgi:predicted AlkP superfamily pyrophosphatase or phosphodiesterase